MKVTKRLQPFTHQMGTCLVMPGSKEAVRIFPARLEPVGGEGVDLPITGPITHFTAIQDLERGGIRVSFSCQAGFVRYTIHPGPILHLDKGNIALPWQGEARTPPLPQERLFFGSHKKLDWELVVRRKDSKELFPIWHRLGLMLPEGSDPGPSLLSQAHDVASLMDLFSAGFYGLMVPSKTDPYHQGFPLPPIAGEDPYLLLSAGARLIRSLFFQETDSHLHLLPALPREFAAGRMLDIDTQFGRLSFEWSKHRLRKAVMTCTKSGTFTWRLPKEVKRFRVNRGPSLDAGSPYTVSEGEKLLFDRFTR